MAILFLFILMYTKLNIQEFNEGSLHGYSVYNYVG
jgi:hypothetical protein